MCVLLLFFCFFGCVRVFGVLVLAVLVCTRSSSGHLDQSQMFLRARRCNFRSRLGTLSGVVLVKGRPKEIHPHGMQLGPGAETMSGCGTGSVPVLVCGLSSISRFKI